VLGFFRIWEIPIDSVHGLLGQFSPALAMTVDEIEGYGLHFQEEFFTKPFITDWVLERVFKNQAADVREQFLNPIGDGRYAMKPEFDTQRKVEEYFKSVGVQTSPSDATNSSTRQLVNLSTEIKEGLYSLISNVLFVRDRKNKDMYHPRIGVQSDYIYEALYDCDKQAFDKLYVDYFYRRNNHFWYKEAMKKLPRLTEATRMLVCAEDLGMVPDCVPWVMDELRILSLEIQSMPKDPMVEFGYLHRNPYRSVATISTHDMSTLRQWWDEDNVRTQKYYNNMLHRGDAAPHPLPGWLAKDIVAQHLMCPSMLSLLSLQDWLAIDEQLRLPDANAERINIPANPRHYWRYRMHLTIEELLKADDFNNEVCEMIRQSGR
jgi:4-alpha-glucanotransferase